MSNATLTSLDIPASPGLDSITVYFSDISKGQGSITINCYGSSWTHYWNAMGNHDVRQFFMECDMGYLLNKLIVGSAYTKKGRQQELWLRKIINKIKEVLGSETAAVQ